MSIKDELTRLTGVSGNSIGDVLDSVDSLGGGGGILFVEIVNDALNKTVKELRDSQFAVLKRENDTTVEWFILSDISYSNGAYMVKFRQLTLATAGWTSFYAEKESDYPILD